MKKKLIFLFIIICISLVGCYLFNDYADGIMEKALLRSSKITEDSDYQQYKMLDDSGLLENGFYSESLAESEGSHDGQIKVDFAENRFIGINYYYDDKFECPVNPQDCWLNPGDKIFFKEPFCSNEKTDLYGFSGFEAFEVSDGRSLNPINMDFDEQSLTIPDNLKGSRVSIAPIGKYRNRVFYFEDFSLDENGDKNRCNGNWSINDEKASENSFSIKPTEKYTVRYVFDINEYYYVDSTPEYAGHGSKPDKGIIIFDSSNTSSELNTYKVELHKLFKGEYKIETKAAVSGKKEIKIDGEPFEISSKKRSKEYSLKGGEQITIESSIGELNITNCGKLILDEKKTDEDHYVYVLKTPPTKSSFFKFDPSDYAFEHGDIVFSYQGMEIKSATKLTNKSKLSYSAKNVEDGYWLPDGEHTITVNGDDTKKKIEAIKLYPYILVSVHLPQPAIGGSVVYYSGNKEIDSDTAEIYAGSEIKLVFNAWHGWKTFASECIYTVTEEKEQVINADNIDILDVYEEMPDHQPKLNVIIDGSVGENMTFVTTYYVNGVEKNQKGKYEDKKTNLSGRRILVEEERINTYQRVSIIADNAIISPGKAVKILSTFTLENGSEIKETAYLSDLPAGYNLEIYRPEEIATSQTVYKQLKIVVSLADVVQFAPRTIENGKINVQIKDTRQPYSLAEGDIVEKECMVTVTIMPNKGYIATGKGTENGTYSEKMKYSEYVSGIDKIISNHEIKQTHAVYFDTEDQYGTVSFISADSKKTIKGKTLVYAGQEVEMTYEIADGKHSIVYESEGIGSWIDIVKSRKKTTVKFYITEEMIENGSINRELLVKVK